LIDVSNVMKMYHGKPDKSHEEGTGMIMAVLIYGFLRFVD